MLIQQTLQNYCPTDVEWRIAILCNRLMDSNRIIVALTIFLHVALAPIVVLGTNWVLGYQDGLTVANQSTWSPIISAQSILLAAYVAFGKGPTHGRLLWFSAGCIGLTITVVNCYSMLCTFPEPKWIVFLDQLRTMSLAILVTPTMSGLLMLLWRPWFGEIRHPSSKESNLQFSLLDIFVITTIACVAITWFRIQTININSTSEIVPILPLLKKALWQSVMVMSVIWLLFSNRSWFVGLIFFCVLNVLQAYIYNSSTSAIWYALYHWSIVIITLGVFRLRGHRLLGHIQRAA